MQTARIVGAVDLSAVIFVVLAIAWAGYLIPKALKHHDEVAGSTLDEGHADRARVLARRRGAAEDAPSAPVPAQVEAGAEVGVAPTPEESAGSPVQRPALPTRAAARQAARRRRRVLYVLLFAVAVVAGLAFFGIAPTWSVAVPAGLTVVFLFVARLSVRAQQRARAARPAARDAAFAEAVAAGVPADQVEDPVQDAAGILQQELDAALADDGSLWDPLPMNLPTYVGKARARRTVRTIELTGISSSGHDPVDTALVRQADGARKAAEAEQAALEATVEARRVAGA